MGVEKDLEWPFEQFVFIEEHNDLAENILLTAKQQLDHWT